MADGVGYRSGYLEVGWLFSLPIKGLGGQEFRP
jgi:hypothetical protein